MLAAASEAATSEAAPTAEATREATDDAGEPFWVRAATLNWKKKVSFPHKIANKISYISPPCTFVRRQREQEELGVVVDAAVEGRPEDEQEKQLLVAAEFANLLIFSG